MFRQTSFARVVLPSIAVSALAAFNRRSVMAGKVAGETTLSAHGPGLAGLARTLPLPGTHTSWGGVVGVLLFTLGHGLGFPARLFNLGFGADFWFYVREWWSPAHFPLRIVLFQLSMGAFFLWVRERTGSAWAAAVVHCLLNGCLALGHEAS